MATRYRFEDFKAGQRVQYKANANQDPAFLTGRIERTIKHGQILRLRWDTTNTLYDATADQLEPIGQMLPGMRQDIGGLLRLKASAPIKPSKPQIACDHGLFSDEADQLDLCEMFMDE